MAENGDRKGNSLFGPEFFDEVEPVLKHIVKRSGNVEKYDRSKIEAALRKAFEATQASPIAEDGSNKIVAYTDLVEERIRATMAKRHPNSIPAIEEIQDIVESVLVEQKEAEVAKAYILYRANHEAIRDARKLMLDISATMDGYLNQSDWRVNENANVNFSLGGLILHNSGAVTANYWLKKIYPKDISDAHANADLHIHDLSMFSGYCAGWSLRNLIKDGLGGVADKISSKPASHLSTLANQMVNFLGILQNEWAGAQAFSSFDTYLAPFVKVDNLTDKEIKQSLQSFVFGVNTPSRWGSQAPFTNITLDWTVPSDLAPLPAIVGGVEMDFTYGDCKPEMDRINKVFIELMLDGDASGRGFQYPIPTYNITKDFDWESPNAKMLFEMTAKYGTPYFQNFINSDLNPGDVRSMCCRLQLDKRELRKRGGGLFGADELTGSIGVVTINLPKIGYLSRNESEFFFRLDELMDIAKRSLVIKRKVIQRLLDSGLFPYTKRYLGTFANHFNTIGVVGMNECLQNFLDVSVTTATERGAAFALRVLTHMREKLADYQEETGELFNLEATPAESTSYRLAKHDKEKYPEIIASGTDEPYYTNSTQLPVGHTVDIFDALDMQEKLQTAYTGGTVFHVFTGEAIDDWKTCGQLVSTIASRYRIPYFTISPTFSICPVHGYLKGEQFSCPTCEEEVRRGIREKTSITEVYSRIVGYYRSVKNWNLGKKSEYKDRLMFDPAASLGSHNAEVSAKDASVSEPRFNAASFSPTPTPVVQSSFDAPLSGISMLLFTRKACPNCPAFKRALGKYREYTEIDVDTFEGRELAIRYSILSTPTAIALDDNGLESARMNTIAQLHAAFGREAVTV
jgi:ribonucleoside-triphosphate reductase